MKDPGEYRSEFPITDNYSFFNNAAISAPAVAGDKGCERFDAPVWP